MGKEQPPSFQWYPRDFVAAVAGMPDAHELAFRRALDQSWIEGAYGVGSEADWMRWSRSDSSSWPAVRCSLLPHMQVQPDGTWAQVRMARSRMEQELRYNASVKGGSKSAASRLQVTSKPPATLASASASASAFAVEKKQPPSSPDGDGRAAELALDDPDREESPREWDEGFDPFWEEYPRKVAKAAARAAYARLRPRSQRNYDLLMDGLRLHIRKEWYGRDPDKIPHAATWLHQRRFTDAESEA